MRRRDAYLDECWRDAVGHERHGCLRFRLRDHRLVDVGGHADRVVEAGPLETIVACCGRDAGLFGRVAKRQLTAVAQREVHERIDGGQPVRQHFVAPFDDGAGQVVRGAGIRESRFLHDDADRFVAELRHDARGPERVVGAHVLERRVGIFGLPARRLERVRFKSADRRGHCWIVDVHPRPCVQSQRCEREPSRLLLEDVLVANARRLAGERAAAERRAEVEHVVLDVRASVVLDQHVEAVHAA